LAACDDFNRPLKDDVAFYLAVTPVTSWAELKSAAEGTAGPGLIGLAGDIELHDTNMMIVITRPLTITGFEGNRVIRRGAASPFTGELFRVNAGGGLTLGHPQGGTLVLDGGGVTATAALIRVAGGALTLQDGAALQNNDNAGKGGGVSVESGSFKMSGGTISGNKASGGGNGGVGNGGGVYVAAFGSGVFTMTGGTICGKIADADGAGGGVSVESGSFKMSGGTISGNSATGNSATASGGGVYVYGSGIFTKSGGVIYGSGKGGNSNLVKDGSGNQVDDKGHAVYVDIAPQKKRDSTAESGDNLDSTVDGTAGGWE
jgi:hypothetical protein